MIGNTNALKHGNWARDEHLQVGIVRCHYSAKCSRNGCSCRYRVTLWDTRRGTRRQVMVDSLAEAVEAQRENLLWRASKGNGRLDKSYVALRQAITEMSKVKDPSMNEALRLAYAAEDVLKDAVLRS